MTTLHVYKSLPQRALYLKMLQLIPTCFLLALVLGCAGSQGIPKELSAAGPILVWPLPPEDPKIQYVSSIASPEDLGISKGFFKKVFEFFFGKTEERIQQPYGVTADSDGRIYIADSALRVVHVFDMPEQKYWSIRGTNREEFQFPVGVTVDRERRLYVTDAERKAVIGFDRGGSAFATITEGLQRPAGLAFNATNNLIYVVDVVRHEVLVYDLKGKLMFTFGGRGAEQARLNFPTNIAIDREGRVYISDAMNFRVQIFRSDGTFISNFGRLGDAVGDLARETRDYVPRVLERYDRLKEEFEKGVEVRLELMHRDAGRDGKSLAGGQPAPRTDPESAKAPTAAAPASRAQRRRAAR